MRKADSFPNAKSFLMQAYGDSDDNDDDDRRSSCEAASRLALWHLVQGRRAETQHWLDAARAIASGPLLDLIFGQFYMMQGQLAEAKSHLEASVMVQQSNEAHLLLGDICLIRNEIQQGLRHWALAKDNKALAFLQHPTIARHFVEPSTLTSLGVGAAAVLGQMPFVGDFVVIEGLESSAGQELNGQVGTVTRWDHFSGRIGVEVDGLKGAKAIKLLNLKLLSRPMQIDPDDFIAQSAIDASLKMQVVPDSELSKELYDVNAQVSDALIRSRKGLQVVLHTLTRCPEALTRAFESDPKLAECRHAMEENGLSVQLNSSNRHGPFAFVRPENYEALKAELVLAGSSLQSFRCWHIFADEDLSSTIVDVVQNVPKKEKVYARKTSVVPLSFAAQVLEEQVEASILRTFISIKLPSSMRSENECVFRPPLRQKQIPARRRYYADHVLSANRLSHKGIKCSCVWSWASSCTVLVAVSQR